MKILLKKPLLQHLNNLKKIFIKENENLIELRLVSEKANLLAIFLQVYSTWRDQELSTVIIVETAGTATEVVEIQVVEFIQAVEFIQVVEFIQAVGCMEGMDQDSTRGEQLKTRQETPVNSIGILTWYMKISKIQVAVKIHAWKLMILTKSQILRLYQSHLPIKRVWKVLNRLKKQLLKDPMLKHILNCLILGRKCLLIKKGG